MKFKSDIEIQAGVEAGGSTGSNGQVLSSTGSGVAWINQGDITIGEAETAKSLQVTVKNVSGGELTKGTVVHTAPTASPPSGNVIEVIAADYDDTTKMPAIGILKETIANEAEGEAVMTGALSGIATDAFSIGDELYVGADGALTNVKPQTAGQLIQKIAVCVKSHASNGLIKIFGAGRSNDVPLPLYIDNANQRLGIGTIDPSEKLEVDGNILATGTIIGSNLSGTNTGDQVLPTDFVSAANGGTFSGSLKITDVLSEGSPILDLHNSTNGGVTGIRFTDTSAGTTQFGNITYSHLDTKSYGSGASFTIGSDQSTTTILADGKLMFAEGIYIKPSIGTGAGIRKDVNWDTAYNHSQEAHAPSDAEANVQSDWDATSGDAFILNKPTIPTDFVSAANGGTFSGNIFATNLSGTNTGDQDLSGYALTGHNHSYILATDDRDVKPNATSVGSTIKGIQPFFTSLEGMTGTSGSNYQDLLVLDTYSDLTGGNANAITLDKSDGSMRLWNAAHNATSWGTAKRVWTDADFTVAPTGTNTGDQDLSGYLLNTTVATNTALGLIKLFNNTDQTVAANEVTTTANRTYGLQLNSSNQAVINVPWTNTWRANAVDSDGYVAQGSGQANKVWKTDATGNPAWRTDANTTYTAGTGINLDSGAFRLQGGEIPGGVDLNTYRTTGIFCQNANADAASGSNYPTASAGILEVYNDDYGNGLFTVQRYSKYNSINVYQRQYYNGTWYSWRDLTQDTNTVPTDFVSAANGGTFSGDIFATNLSGTNTGDQDLSGYLTTTGKAADSELLDGIDSTGFVRQLNTGSGNIDDDWGTSFKTFDPIPTGTPPIQSPNIRTINVGENFARRTQLAFDYATDRAWFRRRHNSTWHSWREFWHSGNDGAGSGLDADTLDGQHASDFQAAGNYVTTDTTQTVSGAKTFTSASNYYNGHLYYTPHDSNGNHYPHFIDGGNANGVNVNWRLYNGASLITHTWNYGDTNFVNSLRSTVDLRAPSFYDSDNTGYYLNPASSSKSAHLRGHVEIINEVPKLELNDFTATNTTNQLGYISYQQNGTETGWIGFGSGSNSYLSVTNNSGIVSINGTYTLHNASSRAPIFYDSNNTSYYLDPASTSNLNELDVKTIQRWYRSGGAAHQRVDARLDGTDQARMHWYGKNDANGTVNFKHAWYDGSNYINVTAASSTVSFVNTSPGYATVTADGDFRAPIFYDLDNTGYYLDPAGTSNLNNLTVNGTLTGTASGNLPINGKAADSELIDGIDSSRIVYGNGSRKTNNQDPNTAFNSGFYDIYQTNAPTSTWYSYLTMAHTNAGNMHGHQIAGSFYSDGDLFNRHYDGNGSFGNWTRIWNAANDGAGSGLDADLLDGQHASAFQPAGSYLTTTGKAADSNLLDGINSTSFLRSDATDSFSGNITFSSYLISNARDKGLFGTYDSTKTDQIWSMGTAYRNNSAGTNFGNLYGLAYKHTNNTTGGTMGGGHQMVWCNNGDARGSIGYNAVWHKVSMKAPIFYDSNDTSYYLNPSDTGISATFAGNVGIGVTAPNKKLVVSETTGSTIQIHSSKSGTWVAEEKLGALEFFGNDSSGDGPSVKGDISMLSHDQSGAHFHMAFSTNSGSGITEMMRIQGSGNVGIGTTDPGQKLDVDGNIECSSLYLNNASSLYFLPTYFGQRIKANCGGLLVQNGSTYQAVYASAFSVQSDYRLKSNVVPLDNAIDRLKQMSVHRFNWNDRLDEPKVDGFIAHELSEVIPEAVLGEKDATKEDGTPDYQGIDQSKIVPLLTAALQDAITKIEQLETRIQTLENNN